MCYYVYYYIKLTYNSVLVDAGCGIDEGKGESEWVVEHNRATYDEIFSSLHPINGKLTGRIVKDEMVITR